MPKVSKSYIETKKKQIMQAALSCAARKGFHQTSMRDICKEAKLSIGAVYNHFKNKEEILAAITKQGREAKKMIFDRIKHCNSAREAFQQLFELIFSAYKNDAFRTYGSIDLETYCEAVRNKKIQNIMVEEYDSLTKPIADIIKQWQKKNQIRKDISALYLAHYVIAISVGIKISLLVNPELSAKGFEDVFKQSLMENIWSRSNLKNK